MEFIKWFQENQTFIVALIIAVYGVANLIVGATPSPKDDLFLDKVRLFLVRWSILVPKDADGTVKIPGTKPKLWPGEDVQKPPYPPEIL